MAEPDEIREAEVSLIQLLPNAMTIAAICAGLSAIKNGSQENFAFAVQLIVLAAVIDGLDGPIARLLKSASKMGAELDSLADFLNFGVAPALLLYFWTLRDFSNTAWIAVLIFAVCCVVRLARFNVNSKEDTAWKGSGYFQGVPAPAGALLVLLPMYLAFAFPEVPRIPAPVIAVYMVLVGLLMISHIPTWSFKKTRISRRNVKFFLVGVAVVGAAVLTFAWATLIVLCLGYAATVIWALIARKTPAGS